jgi:hypothetical protein
VAVYCRGFRPAADPALAAQEKFLKDIASIRRLPQARRLENW